MGKQDMDRPHRYHRDGDPDLCLLITAVLCLFVTSLPTVLPTRTFVPGCVSSFECHSSCGSDAFRRSQDGHFS